MDSYFARCIGQIGMVLLCLGTLVGCGGEIEQRAIEDQMGSQFITQRSNVCVGSLDRHPIPSLERFFPAPEGMVFAGFITNWFPGADPFPCNRFKRAEVQGMFEFAGRWPRTPNRVILMDLVDFQPIEGSVNVGGRTSCNFKVLKRYYGHRVDWHLHHGLDIVTGSSELQSRPRSIRVPDDIGRWSAVVTDDLYQTDRTPAAVHAPTVFLIVQNDEGFDANQNGSCAGHFQFRVRVLSTESSE
jgi:hypothetical protein